MLMLTCVTKCSIFHKSILNSSQDSQLNTSLLFAIWLGAVVPHLKKGTVAARHCRDLSDRWDQGRYLYHFFFLTTVFFDLCSADR